MKLFVVEIPYVVIDSSSMDHVKMEFDEWWLERFPMNNPLIPPDERAESQEEFFRERNISKDDFLSFPFKNGFRKGDILIQTSPGEIKIGDVITFRRDMYTEYTEEGYIKYTLLVTHRVINIVNENNTQFYHTKGDTRLGQDKAPPGLFLDDRNFLTKNDIVGKPVFRIPFLGKPFVLLKELKK
jgi:signal peptidase I